MLWQDTQGNKCKTCQQIYAERTPPQSPPCDKCKVELRSENEEVATVYMTTRRQVITVGHGEVVDISIPAIMAVMDIHSVKDKKHCMLKVINLFHHFLNEAKK